jgi:hypothetical protein
MQNKIKNKIPYKRSKELKRYFEANNLGFGKSAKEDNARYLIYKLFDLGFHNKKHRLVFFLLQLRDNVYVLEYLWKLQDKEYVKDKWKPDRRSGEESYGYESFDYIIERLDYISDRWNCQFRIKWLIDLVDKFNKNEIKFEI